MNVEVYQSALQGLVQSKGEQVHFVVVGAMDGVAFDPILSHYIKKFGWKGLFVEPLPDLCEALRRNYSAHPKVAIENSAVSDLRGRRKFWRTPRNLALDGTLPRWAEGIGSLHKDRNALAWESIRPFVVETEVECDTLQSVFKKHRVKQVDLLQIDTEGHDWTVLSQFDIDLYLPGAMCVEMNLLPPNEKEAVRKRVSASGYTWVEDVDLIAWKGIVIPGVTKRGGPLPRHSRHLLNEGEGWRRMA